MPVLTPQGMIGEAPVTTSSPKTITPMAGDNLAPTIAVNNQGKPGYDVYGNKITGTPLPGGGASTPTTISTSDAEKKINEIKNKVDTYNGVASTSTTTEDPAASLLKSELASAKSDAEKRANDSITAVNSLIDPYLSSLSLSKQRQIDAVKQSFAAAQKLLEESNARVEQTVNTAGIRSGTARYSPETQAGIMASEYRASAMRVADLSARENAAIAEIETAMDAKTFSVALSKYQELSKIQETKNKAVDDLQKTVNESLKKAQELNDASNRDNAIAQIISNGISDPIKIKQELEKLGIKTTAVDLDKSVKALTGSNLSELPPDMKQFQSLKTAGLLPKTITSLPPEQQFFAYRTAIKQAEDVSADYQIITDPITGAQSIFNRQSGQFVKGSGPTGGVANSAEAQAVLQKANDFAAQQGMGKVNGQLLIRNIQDRLAKGDIDGSVNLLKQTAINSLDAAPKEKFTQLSEYISAGDFLLASLNSADAKAGPYKALFESKKPYAEIKQDPKYIALRNIITASTAAVRRGYFGTAVTEAEQGSADGFLVKPEDSLEAIINKTKANVAFFKFGNDATVAQVLGLPKPDLTEYYKAYGVDLGNNVNGSQFEK